MILQNSREKTISLDEELETLLLYIELEQLRFKEGFNFTSQIEPNINVASIQVPPMILQPYIENAVIHGISSIDYHGNIHITVNRITDRKLKITVCDNGKGLTNSSHKGSGIGIKVNEERIRLLNTRTPNQFSVNIKDNKGKKGVCVEIMIQELTNEIN